MFLNLLVIKTNIIKSRSLDYQENSATSEKCSVNKKDSIELLIIITLLISFHCFGLTTKNKIHDIFPVNMITLQIHSRLRYDYRQSLGFPYNTFAFITIAYLPFSLGKGCWFSLANIS